MVKRIRGRAGQAMRQRRLARSHYLCTDCYNAKPQRLRNADVVDHIIPLAKGGTDTDDNTRNLCNDCHRKRTAEQFGHSYTKRLTYGPDGWPIED